MRRANSRISSLLQIYFFKKKFFSWFYFVFKISKKQKMTNQSILKRATKANMDPDSCASRFQRDRF